MGHGASTGKASKLLQKFAEVERKCSSGFYHTAPQDYLRAIEAAIEMEALDFLEVLLVGGPVRTAFPAHLASSLGKVEALDLILAAGFPGNTKNAEELTPLHCAVLNTRDPSSASLCAALLCLRYPNLWKVATKQGENALHLAARHDQDVVLETLLQLGADAKQKSATGQSLHEIAKQCNAQKALAVLKQTGKRSTGLNHNLLPQSVKQQYVPRPPSEVDMERIMQVWDRFFENAFKMAEQADRPPQPYPAATESFPSFHSPWSSAAEEEGRRSNDRQCSSTTANSSYDKSALNRAYYDYVQSYRLDDDKIAWDLAAEEKRATRSEKLMMLEEKEERDKTRRKSKKSGKNATRKSQEAMPDSRALSSWAQSATYDDILEDGQAKETTIGTEDATYWECMDWFQHVLCYDFQQHQAYYVIHLPTCQRYWLSDYLSYLATGALAEYYCVIHDSVEVLAGYSLPTNAMACAQLGWMTYFDSSSNQCFWYQLRTEATQRALPLGLDFDERGRYSNPDVLDGLQLVRRDDAYEKEAKGDEMSSKIHKDKRGESGGWYGSPQQAAQSWVLVIVPSEEVQSAALPATPSSPQDREWDTSEKDSPTPAWLSASQKEGKWTGNEASSYNAAASTQVCYYYFNTLTSESQWEPPGSTPEMPNGSDAWLELLRSWDNWRLCCMEDRPDELFWYDLETGDSQWA